MRTVNPVRAGTRSFQPSHLTLSRYYYFISYSSFYLFFLFCPACSAPSRVWWLALLDKPLSPTLSPVPPSFPIRSYRHIHPRYLTLRRHSIQPRRDATPRSISTRERTTTTLLLQNVAQSASRRVSLTTSPGRIGFCALNDSGSLLSPVIRRLDVHFSYSYHGRLLSECILLDGNNQSD